jgi:hypothetical protein
MHKRNLASRYDIGRACPGHEHPVPRRSQAATNERPAACHIRAIR